MPLKNLTPEKFRCEWGECPAVYELEDGSLAIIGKQSKNVQQLLKNKIASDEFLVIIQPDMLANIPTYKPGERK